MRRGHQGHERRQARGDRAEDAAAAGAPVAEGVGEAHRQAGEQHVGARRDDHGSADGLVAGLQDDQPDDGPDAGEDVATTDDEGPHPDVVDVVGLRRGGTAWPRAGRRRTAREGRRRGRPAHRPTPRPVPLRSWRPPQSVRSSDQTLVRTSDFCKTVPVTDPDELNLGLLLFIPYRFLEQAVLDALQEPRTRHSAQPGAGLPAHRRTTGRGSPSSPRRRSSPSRPSARSSTSSRRPATYGGSTTRRTPARGW